MVRRCLDGPQAPTLLMLLVPACVHLLHACSLESVAMTADAAPRPTLPTTPLPPQVASAIRELAESNDQMSEGEYSAIARQIMAAVSRRGPGAAGANVLVFGCGRDSPLWASLNPHGTTLFVEHSAEWAAATTDAETGSCPHCDVVLTRYRTVLRWDARPALVGSDCLVMRDVVVETLARGVDRWDVIVVDGPNGEQAFRPGRMMPIATAAMLAQPGTHVFVHDCERPAEWSFVAWYLAGRNHTAAVDADGAVGAATAFSQQATSRPCVDRLCHFVRNNDNNSDTSMRPPGPALEDFVATHVRSTAAQRTCDAEFAQRREALSGGDASASNFILRQPVRGGHDGGSVDDGGRAGARAIHMALTDPSGGVALLQCMLTLLSPQEVDLALADPDVMGALPAIRRHVEDRLVAASAASSGNDSSEPGSGTWESEARERLDTCIRETTPVVAATREASTGLMEPLCDQL